MTKKTFVVSLLAVLAICAGIIVAQKVNSRYAKQKAYNDILGLPTRAERKELYAKLTPAQKAEIWRNDLLVKIKVYEYTGTEKGQVLRDLSDALFPDLFDTDKTNGSPQSGEFAETPAAKTFFAAMGRYANTFSPEESRLLCGILGEATDPADEKAAKDKALASGLDSLECDCNIESYCTVCDYYCQHGSCTRVSSGCGCFWLWACNGVCPA